jgi:thioester reductase-like protein
LTGCTGLVGSFLLDRLLRDSEARILCLVRARDDEHARRRVLSALDRQRLTPCYPSDRLECFAADLASPLLGMSREQFVRLSVRADLILHAGADTDCLRPYPSLEPANVQATSELIRLAKPRRIPLHFLSTISVIAGLGAAGVRMVSEGTPLAHAERLGTDFARSKWVAERLLRNAGADGLPITIYRVDGVAGTVCNAGSAVDSLARTMIGSGLTPDIDVSLDVVPAGYLAAAISYLIASRPACRETYHLTAAQPTSLKKLCQILTEAEYDLREVPHSAWYGQLVGADGARETSPFTAIPAADRHRAAGLVHESRNSEVFPAYSRATALCALADSGLVSPSSEQLLRARFLATLSTERVR